MKKLQLLLFSVLLLCVAPSELTATHFEKGLISDFANTTAPGVNSPKAIPTVSDADFSHDYANTGVVLTADITADGGATITDCGFIYTVGADPTEFSLPVTPVVQSGNYTLFVDWNSLPQDETLHFKAYAVNADGTGVSSTTLDLINTAAEYTCSQSNLFSTTVTLESEVLNDAGYTLDSYFFLVTDGTNVIGTYEATGDATDFSFDLSSLTPETEYFYYPFGEESSSQVINFRTNCQFTTQATQEPIINGCDISEDETTTTFIGTVGDNGGSTITECGFIGEPPMWLLT
jgi:hypothetical protein